MAIRDVQRRRTLTGGLTRLQANAPDRRAAPRLRRFNLPTFRSTQPIGHRRSRSDRYIGELTGGAGPDHA
jgi:hypothetical protein